jgi:hypothetical protein
MGRRVPFGLESRLAEITANSFKNFHVLGMDYLCLSRSDDRTVKVYMAEWARSMAEEIVNPHDHRYDFRTICLAGQISNHAFRPASARRG